MAGETYLFRLFMCLIYWFWLLLWLLLVLLRWVSLIYPLVILVGVIVCNWPFMLMIAQTFITFSRCAAFSLIEDYPIYFWYFTRSILLKFSYPYPNILMSHVCFDYCCFVLLCSSESIKLLFLLPYQQQTILA